MEKKEFKKYGTIFLFCVSLVLALFATSANAATDTSRPTIIATMPENNAMDVPTDQIIRIEFSEAMDPNTINRNTVILTQQTTPDPGSDTESYRSRQIGGNVSYNGNIATFTPFRDEQNPLQASQEYGNVFTAKITTGARDLVGNSLAQDYIWSFTTGLDQFNTGAATTQTSQAAGPNSPAATNTPTTSTPTTNTGATTNQNNANMLSWGWSTWIIAGVLVLLLAIIITAIVKAPKATSRRNPVKSVKANSYDTFGDTYPVKNIEGIGTKYAARLQQIGIANTKQLWKANTIKTANAIDAPTVTVKSWQNMAELSSIKSIGPQYAELLERSGIHNIKQLKEYDSKKLLDTINRKQDSLEVNIQGNSPGIVTVENWIDQAKSHSINQEGQTA